MKSFQLDAETVSLPKGTRVVLRTDICGEDGYLHKTATVAIVKDFAKRTYYLATPSGKRLIAQRDQITVQKQELLIDIGKRQWQFEELEKEVILSTVVGSHAWGLADSSSDEDICGVFLLPFDVWAGLWRAPDEIQSPSSDAAYWEVSKLVEQGLRGDANTLEMLWSPLTKVITPLGQELIDRRRMFVSMNILGSFGRYAQSQFKKIERALIRDRVVALLLLEIESDRIRNSDVAAMFLRRNGVTKTDEEAKQELKAVCRSLFDRGITTSPTFGAVLDIIAEGKRHVLRPASHRPKNAYNLLRLLHSCIHLLRHGEPLMEVSGDLKTRLLAIKRREVPIEETLVEAKELVVSIDEAAKASSLPEKPDYEAANAFLKLCRTEAARKVL